MTVRKEAFPDKSDSALKDRFVEFLKTSRDKHGLLKYRAQIENLPAENGRSIVVDYEDLDRYDSMLTVEILRNPETTLPIFDSALCEVLEVKAPDYCQANLETFRVRIRELVDATPLRTLIDHIFQFTMITGLITRSFVPGWRVIQSTHVCANGHTTVVQGSLRRPKSCSNKRCKETMFTLVRDSSKLCKYQLVIIQELPEELPSGNIPHTFEIRLEEDLVGRVQPETG